MGLSGGYFTIPGVRLVERLFQQASIYHKAGRLALAENEQKDWIQYTITFASKKYDERQFAESMNYILRTEEQPLLLQEFWFLRKLGCWRIRFKPDRIGFGEAHYVLHEKFSKLIIDGLLESAVRGIYEPEIHAFGGAGGMKIVHSLYSQNCKNLIEVFNNSSYPIGRKELSLILYSALFSGARLEWYEQGDVWALVANERPCPSNGDSTKITSVASDVTAIMRASSNMSNLALKIPDSSPALVPWIKFFHATGRDLRHLSDHELMTRGLRRVLSYIVIFNWNMMGLDILDQSILACAAKEGFFGAAD